MWLSRPLGWAQQLIHSNGSTVNFVTHITTDNDHNIDPDLFQQAVLAVIYNEPHLRADVNLKISPATWVAATDFSQVFRYVDLRWESVEDTATVMDGMDGMRDVWELVEEEANFPWQMGSGRPLYRCVLVKVTAGYVVINISHQAMA